MKQRRNQGFSLAPYLRCQCVTGGKVSVPGGLLKLPCRAFAFMGDERGAQAFQRMGGTRQTRRIGGRQCSVELIEIAGHVLHK